MNRPSSGGGVAPAATQPQEPHRLLRRHHRHHPSRPHQDGALVSVTSLRDRVLLLLSVPVSSSPCHFPAVVNLGDSNSDTGGLSAAFGPVRTPYGETFFRMPAGRYSDGRLIIDFIAESFGLPYLSAYLDSLGTNFRHGANFASAGATIMPQNVTLSQGGYSPFSLDVQLDEFLQFKSRSQTIYERGGVYRELMPRKEYFSRALYTFDIGQNDITAFSFLNISANDYIPNALNEFSSVIKSIYEEGGRSFWIHNTGPLGCLSYVLLRMPLTAEQLDSAGCAIPYNHYLSRQKDRDFDFRQNT
ncbi:GDSL esterase/lipase At3g26430-like isoform X2 [Phoenix dactylifera]|uniref:GDSL esterase/lipase At3g26430-like isoform X2 n=2 Tax=Phoenix dactylifera TaxID=42345 RepID=A0A8B9AGB8_PHODC|nr:GDSL esterase/lipase At3g26430-like isoform X2 [Phoenix dactylifera]XP_038985400.1 GDSL esterase/lipase At3g26430-like isoform X2 [Phoenix dactylifera]